MSLGADIIRFIPLLTRFYEAFLEEPDSAKLGIFAVFWNERISTVGVLQGCFGEEKQFAFD
jgi:hypothetical protein